MIGEKRKYPNIMDPRKTYEFTREHSKSRQENSSQKDLRGCFELWGQALVILFYMYHLK